MSPTDWWVMYGSSAPTVRKLAIKILSQTASASACERNWSTFALIHTKQRNKLGYNRLEKLVFCYYNMKLKLRDREAAHSHVDQKDPLDVFDIGTEFDDDEERDQLYEWIRPLHLDDEERNPSPTVAREARAQGINVEQVIQEEVIGPDRETIDALVGRANILISSRGGSRDSHVPSMINESSSSTRSGGSSSIRGDDSGGDHGVQGYSGNQVDQMSPFTCETQFTHATQDGDHGSRRAGPGIGAIGKNYTPRERGQGSMSRHENDSLSPSIDSFGVRGSNDGPYPYSQNLAMPYPAYTMPYGVQSSDNSWSQSEGQSSNNYGYGQGQAMPNPYYNFQYGNPQSAPLGPYGWHVNQYMQNYKCEVSFNDYSSQYTKGSAQRDDTDSENFVPHRSSTWF
uniref:uncharacterized protein LOC105352881 n=1 Tax=Fragaria vesca subsp. vesca TaxID=101020 RepID=UPI0005CA9B5F|nr:PREDICTED: uncharacterized protein LOC105352881 [Fragaria vesca subsp. vesca]